jgi:O-antigen ligase
VAEKHIIKKETRQGVSVLLNGLAIITLYFSTTLEDPFNTPKMILLLLLSAWVFGHLINSYKQFGFNIKAEEKMLNIIIIVIIGFMFISSYLANMPVIAFFGDIQRRNGFLTYACLIVLLLFTYRATTEQVVTRFFKTAILVGLIMSFYGMLQTSGNDFVDWNNPNNSMISTLGNPNFASAMLAIIVIVSVAILFVNIPKLYKLLAVIIIPFAIYLIIRSNSLQGLLVIAVGLGFYFTFFFIKLVKNKRNQILVLTPYLIFSCLAVAGMLQRGPLSSFLYKDSVSVRGFYWRAAVEMLKNNLWFGVGSDRYGAFFRQYREVEYTTRYGFDITSSNAHNVPLQLFATNGLIVGLFYLIFLGFVFTVGLRKFFTSSPAQSKVLLGILSTWIGFQSQALISIDQIGLSVWGWILSGLILGIPLVDSESIKLAKINFKHSNKITKPEFAIFQTTISIIALVPMIFISYLLFTSERDTWFARSEFFNSNSNKLIEHSEKVLNNPLSVPTNKTKVASYLVEKGLKDRGLLALNKIYDSDPRDLDALRVIAIVLKLENNSAEEILTRLAISKLDPFDAPNYLRLCQLYTSQGMLVDARKMRDKVLEIAPNSELANLAVSTVGDN